MNIILALALLQAPSGNDIDFPNDVMPYLTRLGCNSGSCHGSAKGQKGFKLSLLGYEPELDHRSITRELRGRRINLAEPAKSLILRKPAKELIKHKGGRLMEKGSDAYRMLLRWVEGGAPYRSKKPVELVRIAAEVGKVTAFYSDGSTRDVTKLALMSSNDDAIADDDGTVKAAGETAIMVRYGGFVASVKVGKPFGPRTRVGAKGNFIDEFANTKISEFGLSAVGEAGDETFLRRATLDAIGRLPTPEEVKSFDGNREKLVDRLVSHPEFAAHWGYRWSRMMEAKSGEFQDWIRDRISKPYDETARELLVDKPYLYLQIKSPKDLSEKVGQAFLGSRWMCAQCHNNPFDRFTKRNYYEMASYFARVRVSGNRVDLAPRGELELDGKPVLPPFGSSGDRRKDLAAWVVKNDLFAKAAANRIWAILMGRGLVEPVDDLRVSNPATHPELLDALAEEFKKDHSIPRLVGAIMKSKAYGRRTGEGGAFYASRKMKPLEAEVLADAIVQATGGGEPRAIKQLQNPHPLLKGESLARTLNLMNGPWLNGRLKPDTVENLYLKTLSRRPTEAERKHWNGADPEYLKDLLWALLNSKEFGTNH